MGGFAALGRLWSKTTPDIKLPESFGITPLLGQRTWRILDDPNTDRLVLGGITDFIWPGIRISAVCRKLDLYGFTSTHVPTHDAPTVDCTCGVYCQLPDGDPMEWRKQLWNKVHAWGQVKLWGKIIRCPRGFRAQYAEVIGPLALSVGCAGRITDSEGSTFWGRYCDAPAVGLVPLVRFGYCLQHLPSKETVVPLNEWMAETAQVLGDRYGIEVLYVVDEEVAHANRGAA